MPIKRFVLLAFPAVFLFLASCATPQIKKWEGKKITLCCQRYACKDESWGEKLAKHCPGKSQQVGAETIEKIAGYSSQNTTRYDSNGRIEQGSLKAEKEYEECRMYECSDTIRE